MIFRAASVAALIGLLGCSGGPAAPKGGSPEWHWENAEFYYERSEFSKMAEELDNVASRETPLNERARVRRTALLMGLARGYMEVGDVYRAAIEEKPELRPNYETLLQQINRDARQFAIELTESLGELDKSWGTGDVVCEFPFPAGDASLPAVLEGMREGEDVPAEQVATASERTIFRGIVLAAAEFCGFGEDPEAAKEAQTAFEAGPVTIANDDARFTVAKIMLDVSLVFSRERVNDPKIRRAVIDRAEQWTKPYLESENEDLKKRAQEFAKEIEDERRDMTRKARRLKKRA